MKGKGRDRRRHGNEDTDISKSMSWLLRHGAVNENVTIDSSGYVPMEELIQFMKGKGHKNIDEATIRKIVDTNDKKRF